MQDSRVLTLDVLLASTSIVGTEVVRAYLQAQDLLEWDATAALEEAEYGLRCVEAPGGHVQGVHGVKGGDRSILEHASRGFRSYVDRASKRPLLTAREERTLSRAARGGCKRSQGKLVERNLLLYVSGARKNSGRGLPLRNLVQEGSLGLMRAAEKFDPEEGYRFSTYATFWFSQAIGRTIANQARTIRLLRHVRDRAGRLLRARTELGFELGRDPGATKLARYLDWETAEVAEVLSLPADADSLGRPLMLPQGDSSLVGDLVRNPHAEDPSDRASLRAELSRLRSEIRRLHSRQREALTLRHGLGERHGEAGTMREMGEAMGVCAATTTNDAERVLMVLRDHLAPPGVR